MDDFKSNEWSVAQEIEALKHLLSVSVPGSPLVVSYIQAALGALESTKGEGLQVSNNQSKTGDKRKPPGAMDSLGGGRLP
ncbi:MULTISPECIES: hypothetical protein [unclassified Pseudomonas]|uniref:hypothetical protein n=1 Tax=unclassified Pseudomonas TaxID=196821 RepID=UPI000A1D7B53|nr:MULTISPECIES: hypothetical protein [unclassified Pseudomonas]